MSEKTITIPPSQKSLDEAERILQQWMQCDGSLIEFVAKAIEDAYKRGHAACNCGR